ncbi:MAG TPA: acyl-CoA dehydrogenase [Kineosporiaceae bacterium]|nr:acyl-CoA dehydrogenase [Kineosporiaceae bacterium]
MSGVMQSEEITALSDTVAAVCREAGGTRVARSLTDDGPGYAEKVWRVLTDEVGLGGLGLPEWCDGIGGLAELVAVGECLGANLMPVPFLSSTVLSGQLLSRCGPAAGALLERLVAGEVVATVLLDRDGRWNPEDLPIRATDDGGWVLDGEANFVLDGSGAAHLVLVAESVLGPAVFCLERGAPGVDIQRMSTLDLARAQAKVRLSGARATLLASGPKVVALVGSALDVTLVVQAAEQLGGAQASLDLTVEYVRTRMQFGRPIGSFQAIKHRCADMLVQVETARSAVVRAVESADAGESPLALAEAASVAKVWCSEAFSQVATSAVHLHGGMGFTWEHDAHLYFRRARSDAALLGDAIYHRERVARLLGW